MKLVTAVVAALLACTLAGGVNIRDAPGATLRLSASALVRADSEGTLQISGLRFRGSTDHSLSVLLLGAAPVTEAELSSAHAVPLDFDRTFDRDADSWVLDVQLPAGSQRPARLQLWCRACRTAEGAEFSGLLDSQQLPEAEGQDSSDAPAAGAIAVVLQQATLPAQAAASQRRRLQAAAAGCSVTVAGTAHTFADCTPLTTMNGNALTVHYSAEASGAGSLVRMAMVTQMAKGWASVGFPKYPGTMVYADAVIMWSTGAGDAQVSGFHLPSELESDVNQAKGTFAITDAAAEAAGGELRAVFTVSLPNKPLKALTSGAGLDYIFALGPVGGVSPPGLQYHDLDIGMGTFLMKQAPAGTSGGGSPAAAATPPAAEVPAPTPPAAEVPAPTPPSLKPASEPAGGDTTPGTSAGSAGTAAGGAGTAATDGAAAAACSLQLPAASGGQPAQYTGCTLVRGVGSNFWLLWKSQPSATNPAKTVVTMAMNASSSGYVSVGFPSRPGRMVGASAMILAACQPGASASCTNGASLEQYYLAGETESTVQLDSQLPISNIQAAALPGGYLAGSFDIELDTPTARRRLLVLQQGASLPLIFAAGGLNSDGSPRRHSSEGDTTVAVLSATDPGAVAGDGGGGGGSNESLKLAHAWLAAIGWGVLIPIGIVMARSFKDARPPLWFQVHRAIQTLGFAMGTVSLGLGFALVESWTAEDTPHAVHRNLGVACTVLGAAQITAIVARPSKGQKYRFAWEQWHHWVGRGAAACAIANIYYGIIHMWSDLGVWAWACYTAVLAVIVATSLVKDTSDWLRKRKAAPAETVQLTRPPSKAPHSPARGLGQAPSSSGSTSSSRTDVEAPAAPAKAGSKPHGGVVVNGHRLQQ